MCVCGGGLWGGGGLLALMRQEGFLTTQVGGSTLGGGGLLHIMQREGIFTLTSQVNSWFGGLASVP